MNRVEVIGLIASLLIVVSMIFKTTTYKGTMLMRIINCVGSIFFVIYGIMLPAYSTMITNGVLFILNIFYIFKERKDYKENNK